MQSCASVTFTLLFLVEATLKAYGFGLAQYVSNFWNQFDALVTLVSVEWWSRSSPEASTAKADAV